MTFLCTGHMGSLIYIALTILTGYPCLYISVHGSHTQKHTNCIVLRVISRWPDSTCGARKSVHQVVVVIVMIIILFEIADEKGEPSGRKVEWEKSHPLPLIHLNC